MHLAYLGEDARDTSHWHVCETLPRKEVFAASNILRQGFRCYFPQIRSISRKAGSCLEVLRPLFPGYLFVKARENGEALRPINGTFGVKRLVAGASNRPQPLPAEVMAAIFERCPDGIARRPDLRPGQAVRVIGGPFSDAIACLERLDARGRAKILLELLGGAVLLDLPLTALAAA